MDFKNNSHACWIVSEGCLWHRARVYICASGYWRARVRIVAAVFFTGYQSFESVGFKSAHWNLVSSVYLGERCYADIDPRDIIRTMPLL